MTNLPETLSVAFQVGPDAIFDLLANFTAPDLGDAACRNVANQDLFFSDDESEIAAAKKMCGSCPMTQLCLDYALKGEQYGVWGGKTPAERIALLAKTNPKTAALQESGIPPLEILSDVKELLTAPIRNLASKYKSEPRTVHRWKNRAIELGFDQAGLGLAA